MELIDWIAILGALAWTPHLFSIIKKALMIPEIRVITEKFGSVGFTTYGSIFNLRLAFSIKNSDIVISDLKIRLKHESGEERIFEWQNMRQQISTITTLDGGVMPTEKNHSVLAIKLNQNDIIERSIECREISYINGINKYEINAIKKKAYLQEQNEYVEADFLRCQEMTDLFNYMKHSFSWKAGAYKAIIEIKSPEKFSLVDNQYEFSLNPIDIEFLDKNKEQIAMSFETVKEDKSNLVSWVWRNPRLVKSN